MNQDTICNRDGSEEVLQRRNVNQNKAFKRDELEKKYCNNVVSDPV